MGSVEELRVVLEMLTGRLHRVHHVGCRGEFDERLDEAVSEAREDVGRVATHWDIESASAFNHREDGSDLGTSFFAAQVQPVTPSRKQLIQQYDCANRLDMTEARCMYDPRATHFLLKKRRREKSC